MSNVLLREKGARGGGISAMHFEGVGAGGCVEAKMCSNCQVLLRKRVLEGVGREIYLELIW